MLWFLTRIGWPNTAVIFAFALAPAGALMSATLGPQDNSAAARVQAAAVAPLHMAASGATAEPLQD